MDWRSCFTKPSPGWTASKDAVQLEIQRLREIPFFELESEDLDSGQLIVIGVLTRLRSYGGAERLRVRLEYPTDFPLIEPFVFDHDQVFRPSADGHQFNNYQLCLRFPARDVFSHDAALVTGEVLGAAWNWMVKRNLFERTQCWPDNAEKHGFAEPLRELAIERASEVKRNPFLKIWVDLAVASRRIPRLNGACPCLSGLALGSCHGGLADLVKRAIEYALLEDVDTQ